MLVVADVMALGPFSQQAGEKNWFRLNCSRAGAFGVSMSASPYARRGGKRRKRPGWCNAMSADIGRLIQIKPDSLFEFAPAGAPRVLAFGPTLRTDIPHGLPPIARPHGAIIAAPLMMAARWTALRPWAQTGSGS